MKKRLICLLLSVIMVAACLAGCAQKTDDEAIDDVTNAASETAITLSMYLLSENEVSAEQEAAIEKAVNRITKAKFKAQIDLKYYTADKYYEALENSFAARLEAEEAGLFDNVDEEENTVKEDETFENEYGMTEIKYPTISGYQVDIFYIGGYEKFAKYMEMDMLQNLNDELKSASKLIKEYVSSDLLDAMKTANAGTYALPTNTAIGEYTYMLLNKEALADLDYNTERGLRDFKSLTDQNMQNFLSDINKYYGSKYVPFYSDLTNTELASIQGVKFWGVDERGELCDDFSVIGSNFSTSAKFGTLESYMPTVNNLFTTTTFYSTLDVIMDYRSKGYVSQSEQDLKDGKAAVACLKGTPEVASRYSEDYVAIPMSAPVLKTEDLYNNMFAVSSYSSSVSRSMQVLTLLNTDTEFRNLILYGIEGENYELVDSDYKDPNGNTYKVVNRLNENYMMDVNKTGNTLIAYSLNGENPTIREFIKLQNRNVSTSITMGFRLDYNDYVVNKEKLQALRALSAQVEAILNECTPEGYFTAKLNVNNLLTVDKTNAALMNDLCATGEGTEVGISFVYIEWAIATGIYVPEEGE